MYSHLNNSLIDSAMLSRILKDLDLHLNNLAGICAIGGTALTLLGLKKGSLDIDIIPLTNSVETENSIRYVIENLKQKKIFIPITENKKEVKRHIVPSDLVIQTFGNKLPLQKLGTFLHLPNDFQKYMHEIKTLIWIMPEGGKEKRISTKKLLYNIELFTLGLFDLICTKMFVPRQKDVEDIMALYNDIPVSMRFLSTRKEQLLNRFLAFIEANRSNIKVIVTGINFYNNLIKKYPNKFKALPERIMNEYKEYLS